MTNQIRRNPLMFNGAVFLSFAIFSIVLALASNIFKLWGSSLTLLWLPNSVLLGVLLRNRQLSLWAAFLGIAAGFLIKDFSAGVPVSMAMVLLGGNASFIGTGYLAYRFVPPDDIRLSRPQSVLYLAVVVAAAAAAMTFFVVVLGDLLVRKSPGGSPTRWFVIGFANGLAILPMVLSSPSINRLRSWRSNRRYERRASVVGPILLLVATLAVGARVSEPTALVFVAPALIWSALTLGVLRTSVLSFLTLVFTLVILGGSQASNKSESHQERNNLNESIQLSYALMSLGPLTVASSMATLDEAMHRAKRAADFDGLTGVLNRRGLIEHAETLLVGLYETQQSVAVIVYDLDNFKQINDTYGHTVGDEVLQAVADVAGELVGPSDLLGRMGGEEFVVIISGVSQSSAGGIAEIIRHNVERLEVLEGKITLNDRVIKPSGVTLSGGVAWEARAKTPIYEMLTQADVALYQAKLRRNRVVLFNVETAEETKHNPA